ncbi:MAG: sulfurtransferase TusA family protein [Desulfobulbus sp.]|nr:MAG: sulfurtransferase TusA family protein [Desulfobulbus sp.]
MDTTPEANLIVHDIRGQICPSTLLFALREVNREQQALKEKGAAIVILTDNRNAIATIPEAVSSMGYATTVEKKDGYYQIEIRARKKRTN